MKNFIILLVVVAVIIIGFILFTRSSDVEVDLGEGTPQVDVVTQTEEPSDVETDEEVVVDKTKTVIGLSVDGNKITAYHYGDGEKEILFIGGIHGGYSWNTALVAYELMDYLEDDSSVVPSGYRVTVIPVLNPDGLKKIVGTTGRFSGNDVTLSLEETIPGRFNSNDVDLNRNFDCDWKELGTWQDKKVSGGSSAFSEPESLAIRSYIDENNIEGAVVWYSAAGGVFSSSCDDGISEETKTLTEIYANASGYPAYQEFDAYEINGDMANWFAKDRIPTISVLLTDHTNVEWEKNRKGIDAILEYFSK